MREERCSNEDRLVWICRARRRARRLGASAADVPAPDVAAVREHLAQARRMLAGAELYGTYVQRCITAQAYPQFVNDLPAESAAPAARVFDQLYFIGQNDVSSWALDTTEGVILFDALNGPEDVAETIVPGLKKLGLDPTRIRYIVLTHAHGDHYGGVKAVKASLPGARVVSTEADWKSWIRQRTQPPREGMPAAWGKLAPERDMTVAEGDTLKLGAATLHFYVTPGHTPGTLTTVFDVTRRHGRAPCSAVRGARSAAQRRRVASIQRVARPLRETGWHPEGRYHHREPSNAGREPHQARRASMASGWTAAPLCSRALPSRRAFSSCRQSVVVQRSAGWGSVAERNASIRLLQGPRLHEASRSWIEAARRPAPSGQTATASSSARLDVAL